jgi:DNA-directed RNA polymerase specialized sigma24 family protein
MVVTTQPVRFREEPRMKLHRKAKTTPASRFLLVSRVEHEQWSYAETAEAFGVSERTVGKWVQRFRQGGLAAREDASSGLVRRRIRRRRWRCI